MSDLCSRWPAAAVCDYLGLPDADRMGLLRWTEILADLTGHPKPDEAVRDELHG